MINQEKYKNKYRIKTARLADWDYSHDGVYFVTICTKNRGCFFGTIKNNQIKLSEIGKVAEKYWQEIPEHFPFAKLDTYCIMPNHIHGIIVIHHRRRDIAMQRLYGYKQCKDNNIRMSHISPRLSSLSAIIRSFKSAVSKNVHIIFSEFSWQSRFHDHIIRDEEDLRRIQEYIMYNHLNWNKDKNNPIHIK